MIAGDFNLHIDNEKDPEAQLFTDMMAALGLDCHVNIPTDESGHSLDLLFTEMLSEMKIRSLDVMQVPTCQIITPLNVYFHLKKCNMQKKEIKYRKLKSIVPMAFSQHLKLDGYEELSLDEMVKVIDKNLQDAINALAPIKSRTILVRTTNPWFNIEVRNQKRRMRN